MATEGEPSIKPLEEVEDQPQNAELDDQNQLQSKANEVTLTNEIDTWDNFIALQQHISSLDSNLVMKIIANIEGTLKNPESKILSNDLIDEKEKEFHKKKLSFFHKYLFFLDEKLAVELENLKRDHEKTINEIESYAVNKEELHVVQNKIAKYEKFLESMYKDCPFLKEDIDLQILSGEIKKLETLRQEHDELQNELENKYHGLKPDFTEAKAQLSDVINEYNCLKVQDDM